MPRSREVGVALLALVAFLGAAELATRRWIMTPATSVNDPRFGIRPEPHQRYIGLTEGYCVRRTNAFGFFDEDTLPVRPPRRVLLLGDSFAEGLQMAEDQTLSEVAEARLAGTEVINAAQSGRFPTYYAATLPEFDRVFRPDAVVIQVNDGDLDELGNPTRTTQTLDELAACRAAAGADLDRPAPPRRRGMVRRMLHECTLLKFAFERWELLQTQERIRWTRKWRGTEMSEWERTGAVPPLAPALLDSLTGVMRAGRPRLVFVYLPHLRYFDAEPGPLYPARAAFWREFAARRGLPLVDPTEALLAEFRRTGQPTHGFANSEPGKGHLNARGHAVVGRMLADALERLP